jgi:hypothetical protein
MKSDGLFMTEPPSYSIMSVNLARRRSMSILSFAILTTCTLAAAPQPKAPQTRVELRFVPASDDFAAAVRDYEQIWAADGARIVAAMEQVSGLSFVYEHFADTSITATVLEKPSSSGFRDRSGMELRASYPPDTKRATLIHELGHRLMAGLYRRDEEEHGALFLWVYDVWVALYGKIFADEQVVVERRRRGPYTQAWDEAMRLTAEERAARWRAILADRLARRR